MTKKSAKPSKEAKVKSNNSKKGETAKDLKEKIKNEEEKYLRLFAEFENYKKRTTKERIELYKTAGKEVISGLIPVLEDFKRALNPETGKFDDSDGINLIYNKLLETLKGQGLVEIQTNIGEDFDSEKHEAISQIPTQKKGDKGKIIDIIEVGYSLGDKIIKFPKVVVAQ
tara:strand:- start:1365 stop:1874 length:510 start_codon:yes stop_codon:yes gene_type:complete